VPGLVCKMLLGSVTLKASMLPFPLEGVSAFFHLYHHILQDGKLLSLLIRGYQSLGPWPKQRNTDRAACSRYAVEEGQPSLGADSEG